MNGCRAVGVTLANIDSAPVRLNAVLLSDAFASPEELASRLYQNYSMQLVPKLLLSTIHL